MIFEKVTSFHPKMLETDTNNGKDSVNDDDLKKRIKECRLPPPDEDHNGKETILHSLVNFINDQNLKKGAEVEKYKPLVKIVLEHDFSLMEAGDKEGRTALLVAIRDGRIRLLEVRSSFFRHRPKEPPFSCHLLNRCLRTSLP